MTALSRNPTNKDLLQSTKFRLSFDRLKGATYFCQTANIPGVNLNEVPRNTPFVDLYVPGEKLYYDTFNITFLIDEDLQDWIEIHNWIRAMTFPVDFDEYKDLSKFSSRVSAKIPPQYTDATLSIFTNKNNPSYRILFKDLFPTSLSTIQFSTMDSAENIITADASFRFSYYNIQKV
jgi:hypothetical protein